MATRPLVDHRTLGSLVLSRLAEVGIPKALAPHAAAFETVHQRFASADVLADEAKKKRDESVDNLGDADTALDNSIDPLADKMVGAGLGTRKKPFGDATPYSPSDLKNLPYKTEVEAVRDLVAKVRAKKPPAEVGKLLDVSFKAAAASEAAMDALTAPQTAYSKALGVRDAILPEWTQAFTKLKVHAKAVWLDDAPTFDAVFAPPAKVQRPVKKKKAKAKAKEAQPATPTKTQKGTKPAPDKTEEE